MFAMHFFCGSLYIFGGRKYESLSDEILIFNIEKTTTTTSKMPCGLCAFASSLYKEYVIIFGGTDGNTFMNKFFIYSITQNKWEISKVASAHEGRISSTMVIENNFIIIYGGSLLNSETSECLVFSVEELFRSIEKN